MTEDEMKVYAARHGLTEARAEDWARMAALSVRVAATGLSIARMAEKSDEPAGVFRVPLRR
jgi:hypothetical protein